jgi:hypothetical protein
MRFSIDVSKSGSALYSDSSSRIIYENLPHSGKVNHQTVVTERTAAHVVPAAPNCRQKIVRASEVDCCNHISNAGAPGDHLGVFSDAGIPDLTRFVVANIRGLENLTLK